MEKLKNLFKSDLDREIDSVARSLGEMNPMLDSYSIGANNLEILCRARSNKKQNVISGEIVAGITNLTGIVMILNFEKIDIVTSKAIGMIKRV